MSTEYIMIFTTAPSKEEARIIISGLMKKKLVACANVLADVDSTFLWKGKVEKAKEVLILFKTRKKMFKKAAYEIKRLHSYEVRRLSPCRLLMEIRSIWSGLMNMLNNQAPRNNNQTMTNNQIQIIKQKLTRQFGHWLLNIGICLVIVACLLVIGSSLSGCATIYNPATARQETILIDTNDEVAIGRRMASQIERRFQLDDDMYVQARVNAVGNSIARVSDRQDLIYYFKVLKGKEINAFTTPGAFIYVFRGLVDKTASDGELASVIAHEVGHVAARHAAKKMEMDMGYNLLMSLVFGKESKPELERYINIGFNLISLGYSREDEFFADKLAVKYLIKAGYNPYDMLAFMMKLEKIEKDEGVVPVYILSSHPYMSQRIEAVKKEILEQLRNQ